MHMSIINAGYRVIHGDLLSETWLCITALRITGSKNTRRTKGAADDELHPGRCVNTGDVQRWTAPLTHGVSQHSTRNISCPLQS